MNIKNKLVNKLKLMLADSYHFLDGLYLPLDRKQLRRTRNIRLIPTERDRRGGKHAYSEWAHVVGIFQTLMFLNLKQREGNRILDVGCGTGLLGIAAEPFVGQGGEYVGLDVMKRDIEFCRRHYKLENYRFIHLDVKNPTYAPRQRNVLSEWPVESERFDLTTALSVWTHLNEEDALFYFKEIARVLKPGGKAIVTFFLLDEVYEKSLPHRSAQQGRFHMKPQNRWIFDQAAYGSDAWRHPKSVKSPEGAIGITPAGLDRLISHSGLKLIEQHLGNWKEIPGVFFQDVLIFEKS